MKIHFVKYHGTGNDFIIIDNMNKQIQLSDDDVKLLCHRHFGIGSDGIILLEPHAKFDFEMVFFNPDASQSFCGNGSRCAVQFASELGLIDTRCEFLAIDGTHMAALNNNGVQIKMKDVDTVTRGIDFFFIDTGSPHHVVFVEDVNKIDVIAEGRAIRYADTYLPHGTNVDFVMYEKDAVNVRIYERGVENETYSSGTGTTAIALATYLDGKLDLKNQCPVHTRGGEVLVSFKPGQNDSFHDIWMSGPVKKVYTGSFDLPC